MFGWWLEWFNLLNPWKTQLTPSEGVIFFVRTPPRHNPYYWHHNRVRFCGLCPFLIITLNIEDAWSCLCHHNLLTTMTRSMKSIQLYKSNCPLSFCTSKSFWYKIFWSHLLCIISASLQVGISAKFGIQPLSYHVNITQKLDKNFITHISIMAKKTLRRI